MERLWAPWRMEYIRTTGGDDEGCFLCEKPQEDDPERALVLLADGDGLVMLNAYPYNPGHLLVAPRRHVAELEDLSPDELAAVGTLLQRAVAALRTAIGPNGFNLGMNLGRIAGAGLPDHLHWHVVPRWSGDTNFMPIVGETRVLPEMLVDTYAKLKPLL